MNTLILSLLYSICFVQGSSPLVVLEENGQSRKLYTSKSGKQGGKIITATSVKHGKSKSKSVYKTHTSERVSKNGSKSSKSGSSSRSSKGKTGSSIVPLTSQPNYVPVPVPTPMPSNIPIDQSSPSSSPSKLSSLAPNESFPSSYPTHVAPFTIPSSGQSLRPSIPPSLSGHPSSKPSLNPSSSLMPTSSPSSHPTYVPSSIPSSGPSLRPSILPSLSVFPSWKPSLNPTSAPSDSPSSPPSDWTCAQTGVDYCCLLKNFDACSSPSDCPGNQVCCCSDDPKTEGHLQCRDEASCTPQPTGIMRAPLNLDIDTCIPNPKCMCPST